MTFFLKDFPHIAHKNIHILKNLKKGSVTILILISPFPVSHFIASFPILKAKSVPEESGNSKHSVGQIQNEVLLKISYQTNDLSVSTHF